MRSFWINSNLHTALNEVFFSVYLYRLISAALAVQKLIKLYLFSSDLDITLFSLESNGLDRRELFSVHCLATEPMMVYCSGAEVPRQEKIRRLAEWRRGNAWLHPCVMGVLGDKNCGLCHKCRPWQTQLYLEGRLERYANIIDVNLFLANLRNHVAEMWKIRHVCPNCAYIIDVLREAGKSSPFSDLLGSVLAERYRRQMRGRIEKSNAD